MRVLPTSRDHTGRRTGERGDEPSAARGAQVQEDLCAVERFLDEEASRLAAAIAATGHATYPMSQQDRDALFLLYRGQFRLTS